MKKIIVVSALLLLCSCYSDINGTSYVFPNKDETYLQAKIAKLKTKNMDNNTVKMLKVVLKAEALKLYNNNNYTIEDFGKSLNKVKIIGCAEESSENQDLEMFKKHIFEQIKNKSVYPIQYLNDISEIL